MWAMDDELMVFLITGAMSSSGCIMLNMTGKLSGWLLKGRKRKILNFISDAKTEVTRFISNFEKICKSEVTNHMPAGALEPNNPFHFSQEANVILILYV